MSNRVDRAAITSAAVAGYVTDGKSIRALAKEHHCSYGVMRDLLLFNEVTLRSRGGANKFSARTREQQSE